jgi:hypothetical protein
MGSRLSHHEVKEISYDHAEEFLDRPGDERRAELEEKEVNKTIESSGVSFFHINPQRILLENGRVSRCPNDVS